MIFQLGVGCIMILATTVIHGFATLAGVRMLRRHYGKRQGPPSTLHDTYSVALLVLWLFLATVVEIWLWAGLFIGLGAIETLEEALYFSTVTFSTLGYGDIVLDTRWRLLASFAAANGLFLFGWSTALLFAVVQRLDVIGDPHHRKDQD
jgi:polyferredoxin